MYHITNNNANNKNNNTTTLAPVIVTDENGVAVTDVNGEMITVVPETEVHEYTDANGEKQTTIVYKDATVNVPVTVTFSAGIFAGISLHPENV